MNFYRGTLKVYDVYKEITIMAHTHFEHPAVTLSVRVAPKVRDQLEELADATGRTKSFLAAEAIESYLNMQMWQLKSLQKTVKKANNNEVKFVDHTKVADWLESWGTEEEQDSPK